MAAGKNDVIKLLPPLTLSEDEAGSFLQALDIVLGDVEASGGKNWGVVHDIAVSTLRRRGTPQKKSPESATAGSDPTPSRGTPVDLTREDVCLVTGASGFIGGRLAQRLMADGRQVRCLVRASSDTSALEQLGVEIAVGDLTDERSLARAVEGCSYVFHCGALVSDWATTQEITQTNVHGTRSLLEASAAACVERFVHFSSTDVYGHPNANGTAIEEAHTASGFSNWYAQSKLLAEAEVRRVEAERSLQAVILRPATVYGPGSREVVGEIARAIRSRRMLLVGDGRAVAGLCYVDNLIDAAVLALHHQAAPGRAFNVSDGLDVTWRQFTDGLAEGLGCARVRWSVPYWAAGGLGFSLEHGYRLLRRTTGLSTPPLLSRQAVQVLGRNQDFSNRRAREMLGWAPRVDYSTGLRETVQWLRAEYLEHA
jgi:nucleoside-diphosphate-sugar epimerase